MLISRSETIEQQRVAGREMVLPAGPKVRAAR
jgi:hypothetical protein